MKALNNKELRRIANGNGPTEIRWAAIKELQSRPVPQRPIANKLLVGLCIAAGIFLAGHANAMMAGMIGSTVAGIDDAQQRALQHQKAATVAPVHMVCDGQQVTVTDTAIVVDGWRYANPVPVNGDQPVNVDIKAFADSNRNVAMVVDVADQTYLQTGPEHVAVCHN